MSRCWCVLLGVLALSLASEARAELTAVREHVRQMDSGHVAVAGDFGLFVGSAEGTRTLAIDPSLFASLRLGEYVLETAMPFAYGRDRGRDETERRFAVGNPFVGLSFLPDTSCGLARLTLGFAYDLADDTTPMAARALALGRAVRGDWDGYLLRDHMLPLIVGAGTLKDLGKLRLAWDADLVFGLPAASRDFEFGVQSGVEAGIRMRWHTNFGLRTTLSYYPTLEGDTFQSAGSFFLRHARPEGDSFGAQFVVNFDGPAGFSFSDGGVWGASLYYATSL